MRESQYLTFPEYLVGTSRPHVFSRAFFDSLICGALLLLIIQVALGTSIYFAIGVFVSLLVVIFTWWVVGLESIAGILIAIFAFNYLVFSQIAKTVYGQPGDSNLSAPETTIVVLLLGIVSICAAAILVSRMLGNRRLISVEVSADVLLHMRNITFAIGLLFLIVDRVTSSSINDQNQFGGYVSIAHQYANVIMLAILAENWRVMIITNGKRSLSPTLCVMLCGLTFVGFLAVSKQAMANPLLIYFIGSIAYRKYITKAQMVVAATAIIGGIFILYPAIHLTRAEQGHSVTGEYAGEFFYKTILDPGSIYEDWREQQNLTPDDIYSLNYLGSFDSLAARFMLIANTDIIVNSVDEDGPYGIDLLMQGLGQLLPTFLYPDKQRYYTGDVLTWYYGLRHWNVSGYPTIGILADSYAVMSLTGVVVFPFVIMLIFFLEIQLFGTRITGNWIGSFFLFNQFHFFSEDNLASFNNVVLRNLPIYIIIILGSFYLADILASRSKRKDHRY